MRWPRLIRWGKAMKLTDEMKERVALMVEHLPPDEAQAEYERRCEAMLQWQARSTGRKKRR